MKKESIGYCCTLALLVALLLGTHSSAVASKTYSLFVGMKQIDDSAYNQKYGVQFDPEATTGVPQDLIRMKSIAVRYGHNLVVLENQHATHDAIIKAIENIGKQIKPGDQFLFYFSGHGSRIKDMNGDELSDSDEVMIAYDDYLIDDEMNVMLNKYFTRTHNLMIVDACHSSSSFKIAHLFMDFKKKIAGSAVFTNEKMATAQPFAITICSGTPLTTIPEPFDLVYFGAVEDEGVAAGGKAGGLLTIALYQVFSKAFNQGTWNQYTYRRLACETATYMSLYKQNLQYHEIGKTVGQYSNFIPFKTY